MIALDTPNVDNTNVIAPCTPNVDITLFHAKVRELGDNINNAI